MKMQVVKCPNCNGEVQMDTSRDFGFCSYCGTKIILSNDVPVNATQAFIDNREAALDEIERIMDFFDPIAEEFEKLDMVNDQLDIMNNESFDKYGIIGLCVIGASIFFFSAEKTFAGIMGLIAGGVLVFLRYFLEHNNNKSINRFVVERKRLSRIIIDTYKACPKCPVGIEYCRPETLYEIYDYIRKGRAETIKEAINLLEADEHNAEMKRIAKNTQAIAEANLEVNTINAINSILK